MSVKLIVPNILNGQHFLSPSMTLDPTISKSQLLCKIAIVPSLMIIKERVLKTWSVYYVTINRVDWPLSFRMRISVSHHQSPNIQMQCQSLGERCSEQKIRYTCIQTDRTISPSSLKERRVNKNYLIHVIHYEIKICNLPIRNYTAGFKLLLQDYYGTSEADWQTQERTKKNNKVPFDLINLYGSISN
jgi:hypothetical protein